jgi:hypothetical protein
MMTAAVAFYTLYRQWLKGPDVQLLTPEYGKIWKPGHPSETKIPTKGWFTASADIYFKNHGSRAGLVTGISFEFHLEKEFTKYLLKESHNPSLLFEDPGSGSGYDTIHNPVPIEDRALIAKRLNAHIRLNLASNSIFTDLIQLLKSESIIGKFHLNALRSSRGKLKPFPLMIIPIKSSISFAEEFEGRFTLSAKE